MTISIADACGRFLDHCRIAKRLSPNTLRAYDIDLAAFRAFAGAGTSVEDVGRERLGARWEGSKAAAYPIARGSYLPIETDEAVLWTQGSVSGVNIQQSNRDVYKEGSLKPTPSPVLVRRFTGQGGWHDTCSAARIFGPSDTWFWTV